MADWIVCIACGLKHSARPDGACPRCRTRLAPQPGFAPPSPEPSAFAGSDPAWAVPPPPSPAPEDAPPPPGARPAEASPRLELPELTPLEGFPLGARIAGLVLYANVLASLIAIAVVAAARGRSTSFMGMGIPIVVDAVVGTLLVTGREKGIPWAIVRAVLGAAVLTTIAWWNAGPVLGVPQLAYSLGLLALLVGRPGRIRIGLGLVLAVAAVVAGFAFLVSPRAAAAGQALFADAASPHVEELRGEDPAWRLPLPAGHWHVQETRAADGARQVSWPEMDAAVWVKAQALPAGSQPDVDALVDTVLVNIQRKGMSIRAHDREQRTTATGRAVLVRATMADDSRREVEGWLVIQVSADAFAVVTAVVSGKPPEVLEELHGIATSLELGGSGEAAGTP